MFPRKIVILAIFSILLVSPAPIRAWKVEQATLLATSISGALHSLPATLTADFDGDGTPEQVVLAAGQAAIQSGDQVRWQSPAQWQVKQALIADLNQDGLPEAVLLVWRPFKGWPVDQWLPNGGRIDTFHNAENLSCHLILIGWAGGRFRERWAGSALAAPVKSFAVVTSSYDGKQRLVTLEAEYADPPSAPARRLKIWEWNGFGFSVVSEADGLFHQLIPALDTAGQTLILTP